MLGLRFAEGSAPQPKEGAALRPEEAVQRLEKGSPWPEGDAPLQPGEDAELWPEESSAPHSSNSAGAVMSMHGASGNSASAASPKHGADGESGHFAGAAGATHGPDADYGRMAAAVTPAHGVGGNFAEAVPPVHEADGELGHSAAAGESHGAGGDSGHVAAAGPPVHSTGGDSGFSVEELAALLDAAEHDDWTVESTLSSSPYHTTQIVFNNSSTAALGENLSVGRSCSPHATSKKSQGSSGDASGSLHAPWGERAVPDGQIFTERSTNPRKRYVRKWFASESGMGTSYQRIASAQAAGTVFRHIPAICSLSSDALGSTVIVEYVEGETLRELVRRSGAGVDLALRVGEMLCEALDELHSLRPGPVVHRDVKPDNIVMSQEGMVLIDLGIARAWRQGAQQDTVHLGTPGYAPPEQFGYGQTTPQSDIYAAGMVLAFCLTGEDPTPQLRESGFVHQNIPQYMRSVLVRATQFDPSMRFANVGEMRQALATPASQYGPQYQSQPNVQLQAHGHSQGQPDAQAQLRPRSQGQPDARPQAQFAAETHPQLQTAARPQAQGYPKEQADARLQPQPGAKPQPQLQPQPQSQPQPQPQPTTQLHPQESQEGISTPAENATTARRKRAFVRVLDVLGKVWNIVLLLAWLLLTLLSVIAAMQDGTEFVDNLPVWQRFGLYLSLIILPSALVAYLLADKRRLRARVQFFASLSWKQELPVCLGAIVIMYILGVVAFYAVSVT